MATSEIVGIFQSDVILRTALVQAINDVRANPWLLDYAFAGLANDELTKDEYGAKEILRAKTWFMKTPIEVMFSIRVADEAAAPPCFISLHLMASDESENTTSDTHHTPREDVEADWPLLSDPFDAESYNRDTGVMVVPTALSDALVLAPTMLVVDRYGNTYPILSVESATSITLPTGIRTDFHGAAIKAAGASSVAAIESASFKESYIVACHAQGEPVFLTYLHSIVVFCLLRYRESLLEARGIERTTLSSTDFKGLEDLTPDSYFARFINVTGYVRQSWPKAIASKVLALESAVLIDDLPNASIEDAEGGALDDLSWLGDQDALAGRFS